jgi:hypothetical protein
MTRCGANAETALTSWEYPGNVREHPAFMYDLRLPIVAWALGVPNGWTEIRTKASVNTDSP